MPDQQPSGEGRLLPCPWCNGEARIVKGARGAPTISATTWTPECGCGARLAGYFKRDVAITAWNTRPSPPTSAPEGRDMASWDLSQAVSGAVLELDALEIVAKAATQGDWNVDIFGSRSTPWCVEVELEPGLLGATAHCARNVDARHIATFDPPTVLRLIQQARSSSLTPALGESSRDAIEHPPPVSGGVLREALEHLERQVSRGEMMALVDATHLRTFLEALSALPLTEEDLGSAVDESRTPLRVEPEARRSDGKGEP